MINLNNISWDNITLITMHSNVRKNVCELEAYNGMPTEVMTNIMSQWNWQYYALKVYDIMFKNGHPRYFKSVMFTERNDRSKNEFVEFMFDVSLTHKVMFVDKYRNIFITESENGQTNIDANLIAGMLNAYR